MALSNDATRRLVVGLASSDAASEFISETTKVNDSGTASTVLSSAGSVATSQHTAQSTLISSATSTSTSLNTRLSIVESTANSG